MQDAAARTRQLTCRRSRAFYAVAAAFLCAVEREVAARERGFGARVGGVHERDADAHGERDRLASDCERLRGEALLYALRKASRAVEFGGSEQDRELLAAYAPRKVACAQLRAQDFGEMAQHLVADRVAPAVVDRLEVVEIAHHHGRAGAAIAHMRELRRDTCHEMAAVRQLREAIGAREFLQLGFDPLAIGNVRDEAVPDRRAVGEPLRPRIALAPAQALLRQLYAKFQVPRREMRRRVLERCAARVEIVGMDEGVDARRVVRDLAGASS